MNKSEIIELSTKLGGGRFTVGGRSVLICCPLAPWTHEKRKDKKPSCAIMIDDGGVSGYKCFSCHSVGSVSDLIYEVNRRKGGGLEEIIKWVKSVNTLDLTAQLNRAVRSTTSNAISQNSPIYRTFDESEMDKFSGSVPKYILDRKITISSCKKYNLGYDKSQNDPRIIFPVRDYKSKLVGIVGRTIRDNDPKYKNYWGFHKELFLYGENFLTFNSQKKLIVVEGMIDTIFVNQELDVDCVGIFGSNPSKYQVEKLIAFAGVRPIISMFDGDKAGDLARDILEDRVAGQIPVFHKLLPRNTDPASNSKEVLIEVLDKLEI